MPKIEERSNSSAPPSSGNKSTNLILIIVLVALGLGGYFWFKHRGQSATDKKNGPPKDMPVPVVAGKVVRTNVPIYLDGLGAVQAFNAVTVRTRVDGQLQKVAFTEGQEVKAGDLIGLIDAAPFKAAVEQAEAKKAQDEVQLANAERDLQRYAQLVKDKIVSPQEYDTQKSLVGQLTALVKADQGAVDSAQVQLDYTTINAPISGRTGIRQVDQGNIVHANDTNGLVVITQLRPISAVFTLPEQQSAGIFAKMGQGKVQVLAVNRDNKSKLGTGELAVIDNQIDTTTATIKLKATFANEKLALWPGQFVNVRVLLDVRTNGLVVPAQVIQRGPDGTYVFVINPDQTVKIQPVKVAQIEDGLALVDEGLQEGEQVVVDGQYRLQTGSKVKLGEGGGRGKGGGDAGSSDGGSTNSSGKGKRHHGATNDESGTKSGQ